MEGSYRHFTLEERHTLLRLLKAKLPIKEIAAQLGPPPPRPPPLHHLPRDRPQRVPRGETVSRILPGHRRGQRQAPSPPAAQARPRRTPARPYRRAASCALG